jgi:hypothetical protein
LPSDQINDVGIIFNEQDSLRRILHETIIARLREKGRDLEISIA